MRLLYRSLGGAAVMAGLLVPLGLVAPARAADPKSDPKPRTLFVEAKNDQKSFTLTAEVDHKDHMYSIGDQVVVTVTSEKDGYLYIFNLDPDGEITCLFPNNSVMDNAITAGTPVSIPSGGKYRINVSEPTGKDIVKVLVTTVPLKTLSLDELNKGLPKKTTFPPIPPKYAKKLFYEAISGDTTGGNPDNTLQEDKNKFQQQNQGQYQEKAKQWACVDIELTTVGKGKPQPPPDKPQPPDKPPVKPSQETSTQDTGTDKGAKPKTNTQEPAQKPSQSPSQKPTPPPDKPTPPDQKPAQKTDQSPSQKPTPPPDKPTPPDQKPAQKPDQKPTPPPDKPTPPDQKPDQKPAQKTDQSPSQKPTPPPDKPTPPDQKPAQKP